MDTRIDAYTLETNFLDHSYKGMCYAFSVYKNKKFFGRYVSMGRRPILRKYFYMPAHHEMTPADLLAYAKTEFIGDIKEVMMAWSPSSKEDTMSNAQM